MNQILLSRSNCLFLLPRCKVGDSSPAAGFNIGALNDCDTNVSVMAVYLKINVTSNDDDVSAAGVRKQVAAGPPKMFAVFKLITHTARGIIT